MSVSSATTTVSTEIANYNKASGSPRSPENYKIMGSAVVNICKAIQSLEPNNKRRDRS